MNESTALATVSAERQYQGLQMAIRPAEASRRLQELQAFVKSVMKQGEDYDTIPGTKKPTLLQPGAQKLCEVYGLVQTFQDVEVVQHWESEPPFFHYRKKCMLLSRSTGDVVAEGIGSCNSRESRYAYRWVYDREVPSHLDKRTLQKQEKTGRGGSRYTVYKLPNPDLCDVVNTIEKMAAKRAVVAAVVAATRSSGIFTQDTEDLPPEAFGAVEQPQEPAKVVSYEQVEHWRKVFTEATTESDVVVARAEVLMAKERGEVPASVFRELAALKEKALARLAVTKSVEQQVLEVEAEQADRQAGDL